jgi:hypothetical protein
MVDFATKVQKKAAADLTDGEVILDARVVQPAGKTMRNAFSSAVFQQTGALIDMRVQRWRERAENAARMDLEASGAMAAAFPTAKCFFTLTDRRVLVHSFSAMSGNPKELLATYPLADFAGMDAAAGKLVSKLTLYMADGSAVPLDVMKGAGDPQRLVDAFNVALLGLDQP